MSHLKERKEKNCLNCNAVVQGRYCHICGQENVEPKESVWHLINHFFQDITHFDGKFFSSLKYLLFKPGFLSSEYLLGRRMSYLNPIRMYVFTSAFFFLIFFSFYQSKNETVINIDDGNTSKSVKKRLDAEKVKLEKKIDTAKNAAAKEILLLQLNDVKADIDTINNNPAALYNLKTINNSFNVISFSEKSNQYKNLRQYDSLQKKLPDNEKDGFFTRNTERRNLYLKEKYKSNPALILRAIKADFIHRFPQILFVSLPLFAGLMRLLYLRRKNIYYVNHGIFSIHLYCAMFILILCSLWLGSIFGWFNVQMPGWLQAVFTLFGFFYLYKAMRNFYEQGRGKTIIKYILLLLFSLIVMVLLFAVFFIFSTFSI